MELNKKEKDLLIRAFTFYYKNYVWPLADKDNPAASDEDYNIRLLTDKLGIRGEFSDEIQMCW